MRKNTLRQTKFPLSLSDVFYSYFSMKRFGLPFMAICAFPLLLAFSCKPKTGNTSDTLSFDTIQVNTVHYQDNDKTKPACNLQITFIYPQSGIPENTLQTLQTLFIETMLGVPYTNLHPKEATDAFTRQYINDFNDFVEREAEIESESEFEHEHEHEFEHEFESEFEFEPEEKSEYLYYLLLKNPVVYNENDLLSFTVEKSIFEGGAHGSKSIYGYVVDLQTGKLIDENTFAGNNYSKNLSILISQKLASANGLSSPDELENIGYVNATDIVPNNNFTLDKQGITYYFNEYEIGAYFLGVTQLFIPYEELNMYIQKESLIAPVTGF